MNGDELKAWRAARGLTIYQLGEMLAVAGATVSRWETGQRRVPTFLWRALEHLDCKDPKRRPPAGPSEDTTP